MMLRCFVLTAAVLVGLGQPVLAGSEFDGAPQLPTHPAQSSSAGDRLLIVDGNTGHVIYDDGSDDLFCVTRKVLIGYDEDGYPVRRGIMKCR